MTKTIFLDTNNWIYLSNGFNIYSKKHDELHLKIFEKIISRCNEGSLIFLVNDIVLSEWDRNKKQTQNQIKEIKNKFDSYTQSLITINQFISNQNQNNEITSLIHLLGKEFKEKTQRHKSHIEKVEYFLKEKTVKIPISDKVKIEATDLALQKKAPFIGDKKNSMADALIFLSSIEYLSENPIKIPDFIGDKEDILIFPESYFVSSNQGDFSSKADRENIHEDLKPYLEKTNTEFSFTLSKLINTLEDEFLTFEEQNFIDHFGDNEYCGLCNFDLKPTIEFSEYFEIFNPNKHFIDKNQVSIEFQDIPKNTMFRTPDVTPMSSVRTANCENCNEEFIECYCGELNHIKEFNVIFSCIGDCGTQLRVNVDQDRKGMIHNISHEIIKKVECIKCGNDFENVDENKFCETCAEYEKNAIEK